MTIALLVAAAIILMVTMLFLTVGVNDLEKKSVELAGLIRKRYTLRQAPKAKNTIPGGGPAQGAAPGKP